MENALFTLKNWKLGNFRLKGSNCTKQINIPFNEFDRSQLSELVLNEIQIEQRRIFEEDAESLFLDWKKIAEEKIHKSRIPEIFIKKELQLCIAFLEKPLPKTQNIKLLNWNLTLDRGFVGLAQNYFKRVILEGENQDYSYVCSLNDKHRFEEQDPFAFAEAFFRYKIWLQKLLIGEEEIELAKFHNEVFNSRISQDLFDDFFKTASNNELKFSDLSFVFHKMYDKNYILMNQTHKSFLHFVNKYYKTNFVSRDIPKRNQQKNEKLYKQLLQKHKISETDG